jgi:hypothetical protein
MIEITALCRTLKRRKTRNPKTCVSFLVYGKGRREKKRFENEAIKHQSKRFEDQKLVAATRDCQKGLRCLSNSFIIHHAISQLAFHNQLSSLFTSVLLPFVMFKLENLLNLISLKG